MGPLTGRADAHPVLEVVRVGMPCTMQMSPYLPGRGGRAVLRNTCSPDTDVSSAVGVRGESTRAGCVRAPCGRGVVRGRGRAAQETAY